MQYVVIVGAIGLAILLIACFNFINLAVAMNIKRYREAGIKKSCRRLQIGDHPSISD